MSGSLPPPRPDQQSRRTPRTTAPGQRLQKVQEITPGSIPLSQSIGSSGSPAAFFTGAQNANGIKIGAMSISSAAVGGNNSPQFLVEDQIVDDAGNVYISCEIGLPQNATAMFAGNSAYIDYGSLGGVVIPAGTGLSLVNGGANGSGALRRCSGQISATVL